jgi:hypothetical protein
LIGVLFHRICSFGYPVVVVVLLKVFGHSHTLLRLFVFAALQLVNLVFKESRLGAMKAANLGFNESSDEETLDDWRKTIQKKPVKKPLVDDSVYLYDEHYDSIEESRNSKKPKVQGSQYIGRLLEAKEKRKEDKQRLEDIKVARERELEGDQYRDKEVFVTTGYREYKDRRENEEQNTEQSGLHGGLHLPKSKPVRSYTQQEIIKSKEETTKPKSRLLPKLPDEVIKQFKERYLLRKLKH